MAIFMVQGAWVGVLGTAAGLLLGLGIACNIDVIVPAIEQMLHTTFLPKDVYPDQQNAERATSRRHLARGLDRFADGILSHALPKLARESRAACDGAALI